MTALLEPQAEQLDDLAARRLLEQAGRYVREALAFPDDVANLRTITAELLLENAMLRLDVQRLAERVERLERRTGGGR
jgi:ubiquinone biosynthesis protein UbiJ